MTQHRAQWPSGAAPWEILGVEAEATAEEIRTAYLRRVGEYPPDRSPREFERIRDAYDLLRDPQRRTWWLLSSADPDAPFVRMLDGREGERHFTGPGPWLDAIKES